ncbi:MAG: MaoC/PaaZ C-terminal domain-containing protein [Actinomycetota bacterium]|nr:MaoC/PaaZ C-terminal domain-containing protein [Actinomycetota bacterium]
MDPADLVDQSFGPYPFFVSPAQVGEFISVTRDLHHRWKEAAPPGFMAAALFVVAPELLSQLEGRSVIHGEQSFTWMRALEVGATLAVSGKVTRSRERGGVHFTTFDIEVSDGEEVVATGSSLFLISGEETPARTDRERPEPAHDDRGSGADDMVAASRADLIHYAAATGDWNPIHWDHDAAVAAGMPGVVVHGLLQAAWALRTATMPTVGQSPLIRARIRFRNPLLPADPAEVHSEWTDNDVNIRLMGGDQTYITARVEFADE